MEELTITQTQVRGSLPDPKHLTFGKVFTDHLFFMNYSTELGWHRPRIEPYGPLALDPASMVLHYGQEVFEGLKAYRTPDGGVQLFRPMDNLRRMNASCARMSIPAFPEDTVLAGIRALVTLDAAWVPGAPDTSLYLRPFIIATDAALGVHSSETFLFCVICSPVGSYYASGLAPVRIFVEEEDVRAVRGGTGEAKCGGNYAASLRASYRAERAGYDQVLWLDGVHGKYIEEVGSMNVFFQLDGKVVTPPLSGSVLPGITRRSCLDLLAAWDIPAEERAITAEELFDAGARGALTEAFGSGTAAVISPIGEMTWGGRTIVVNHREIGPLTARLYETLTGIQWGLAPDPFGWTMRVV